VEHKQTRVELLLKLCEEAGITRASPKRSVLTKREVTHLLAFVKARKTYGK